MRLVLIAAAVGLVIGLFATPLLIRTLKRHGYAQAIRDESHGHYPAHSGKRGTPSMGGLVIVGGTLAGYVAAHLYTVSAPSPSGLLVLFLMTGLAAVGFLDDYIKIFRQRSAGLRARVKLGGQTLVAFVFAVVALNTHDDAGISPASRAVSFVRDTPVVLPTALFFLWVLAMIIAASNGVNLTDGLDGLATGASVMVLGAYVVICVWEFGNSCEAAVAPRCYTVGDPLDLAVVAAGALGACFGFLWWNASPAQIFMGDTGSLALGGLLSGIAILSRTELLLLVLGGLFVVITMSVILQVGGYKLTKKRLFLMAPLQHHFELKGWGEVTIVIRFWVIAGLCAGLGLGLFYAEWVGGGGVSR
ncbi:MAG TPA: phospho-N-acetylmuramoyl-pentapeptide-transferase [Actinomycetes bacterium]|nr:phospho-N-acetylmuramoyl-pentapeptide-transferase [Actinomycetes bacterium]